jgi:hypothetical protein
MRKAQCSLLAWIGIAAAAWGQSDFAVDSARPRGTVASAQLRMPKPPSLQQAQATAPVVPEQAQPMPAPALQSPIVQPAPLSVLQDAPEIPLTAAYWGSLEYLGWDLKGQGFPSLITTGNPLDLDPGALGQPGTRTLFGGNRDGYGLVSGARLTLGASLDSVGITGVEASGFYLDRGRETFAAASNAAGQPPLYFASFRPDLGREGAVTIASPNALPGVLVGSVNATTETRFYGLHAVGVRTIYDSGPTWVQGLMGVQYMNLSESFRIRSVIDDRFFDIQTTTIDSFTTRNQFIGAVVGARVGGSMGAFFGEVTAKVGIGGNRRHAAVNGTTFLGGACELCELQPGVQPAGGIYAQRTNIGRDREWGVAVIPQVQARVGYEVVSGVRVFAGYDFLWWNDTVRPEDRLDRVTNLSQRFGKRLLGAPRPAPRDDTSDFWASGFSIGLDIRY